ncbi:hypothetical protein TKK_0013541 [Trichogramma kaykai]|uniref:EF-hand domain-containing protein n=1 Tax=Trichogramma kaykai TaxID=54128 RepID=A0ABD2WHF2_9HYME
MKKFDLTCRRLPRLTVLVSLLIYSGLLLVHYRHTLPLKIDDTHLGDGRVMEKLLLELEENKIERDPLQNNVNIQGINVEQPIEKREQRSKGLLEMIFTKADTNEDKFLDIKELSKWIHGKIIDHIDKAMRDNIGLFTTIDNNPRDGEVTWDEYHAHFLRQIGLPASYILEHDKRHSALSRPLKEAIMRDRARWTEAARTDPDRLALDEFLAFTHPESSHRALLQMVEDLFEKFDRDGDEQLTEDEFSELPSDGSGPDQSLSLPVSQERREEFRHLIDKNRDGKADRAELLAYIDPRNPRHAIQEARHLIDLSDSDHDGKLKLAELLNKKELFLASKMVDTEGSFHDEFR